MLDAGPATEYGRDVYNSQFETTAIRKLLSSPDYLGRSYLRKCRNTEKYIKNKKICELIDKLRYKSESRKLPYIQQKYANLDYKGYDENILDGGFAAATYKLSDTLDLGNAYPPQKGSDLANQRACESKKQLDLGNAYPPQKGNYNLGNAYSPREGGCGFPAQLDLGNAYPPQKGNYNLGNAYSPREGGCGFPAQLDLGNAYSSQEFNYSPCR